VLYRLSNDGEMESNPCSVRPVSGSLLVATETCISLSDLSMCIRTGIIKNRVRVLSAAERAAEAESGEQDKFKRNDGPRGIAGSCFYFMQDPFDRKSDVYTKLVLHPWLLSVKTHVVPNIETNAAWDQTLYIPIDQKMEGKTAKLFGTQALMIQLWDSDIGENTLLSDCSLPLEDMVKDPGVTYSVSSDLMSPLDHQHCATLCLEVTYENKPPPTEADESLLHSPVQSECSGKLRRRMSGLLERKGSARGVEMKPKAENHFVFKVKHVFGVKKAARSDQFDVTNDKKLRRKAALVTIAYFTTGALFYRYVEGWSIVEGVYFSIVCITTVGYGDLLPSTDGSKMFTMIYVTIGTMSILTILTYLIGGMMEKQSVRKRMLDGKSLEVNNITRSTLGTMAVMARTSVFVLLFIFLGMVVFHLEDVKLRPLDALYMSVITINSVGFGDFSPQTKMGRFFAIFWIIGGTTSVAYLSGTLAETYLNSQQQKLHEALVENYVDEKMLLAADSDCDGKVNEFEYVVHMLTKMKKVDAALVTMLRERFDELDISGDGNLTATDFIKNRRLSDETGNRGSVAAIQKRRMGGEACNGSGSVAAIQKRRTSAEIEGHLSGGIGATATPNQHPQLPRRKSKLAQETEVDVLLDFSPRPIQSREI
jgi:potassium channel subfamily K